MNCRNIHFILLIFFLILGSTSCVSTHIFEDAQVLRKGNKAFVGSSARAVYVPKKLPTDQFTNFYSTRNIGTTRLEYVYGAGDRLDIGAGVDIPLGIHAKAKFLLAERKLRHIHSAKLDVYFPIRYYFLDDIAPPLFSFSSTYLYTYRYDDLLSVSANAIVLNVLTEEQFAPVPGVAAGVHVGDEVKFTVGLSYFNNFKLLDAGQIQYLSVEASIKYDLP